MKTLFLLLFVTLIGSSCKKDVADKEVPQCINAKIDARSENLFSVDEYTFQNKTVFTFSTNVADGLTDIYDESCNLVCQIGGIGGSMTCSGEDFSNAVFVKNIWSKR